MREIKTIGIDLAKNIFQIHGVVRLGKVVIRKTIQRSKLSVIIENLSPCLIGMEACSGANYWARKFVKMGHTVKINVASIREALC
jgi:transposase